MEAKVKTRLMIDVTFTANERGEVLSCEAVDRVDMKRLVELSVSKGEIIDSVRKQTRSRLSEGKVRVMHSSGGDFSYHTYIRSTKLHHILTSPVNPEKKWDRRGREAGDRDIWHSRRIHEEDVAELNRMYPVPKKKP